ncbi:hypothetical protein F750_1878 [Streptomyces sp. PAMC 26508]|nr:hypothetical protein F750_1878 [Streptomyces sp. PAMC 26508]
MRPVRPAPRTGLPSRLSVLRSCDVRLGVRHWADGVRPP